MIREDIVKALDKSHQNFIDWLLEHDDKWETGPENKWTTGQHALHILQSLKTLNKALSIPKFLLKFKFGKSNRPIRDYQTVIERYKQRLQEVKPGATFGPSQNMKVPKIGEKHNILDNLKTENLKLIKKTKKWSDKQLDTLILPHPLMGKMPVKEIVMWTAYHAEHHLETLKEKY